jgi:CHASE2 domain-containing sensor protein
MNHTQLKIHLIITGIALICWGLFIFQFVPVWIPLVANLIQVSYVVSCVGNDLWNDIVNFFSKKLKSEKSS